MSEIGTRLADKVAIVTGASGGSPELWGIGEAIAILFARQGAKVLLVSRDPKKVEPVLAQIKDDGGEASFFAGDVSKNEICQGMVAAAVESYGELDIVVNSVANAPDHTTSVVDVDEALWDSIIEVSLKSVMPTSKHAIPEMIKAGGGSIVNISSIQGVQSGFRASHSYSAAKAGMMGLSKSMAVHYGRDNIRVNCVVLGQVHTPHAVALISDEARQMRRRSAPIGTEGDGWGAAWASLFLASDEARWISGVDLPVDAGLLAATPLAMFPHLKDPE